MSSVPICRIALMLVVNERGVVSIERQSKNPSSPLCRFLATHLPNLATVAQEWHSTIPTQPQPSVDLVDDWDVLGSALELRISLDLAKRPEPCGLLSWLPAAHYVTLLVAAGFDRAPAGPLPDSGTSDPLLVRWTRTNPPLTISDEAQRGALSICVDLIEMQPLAHKRNVTRTVDERRGLFLEITGQGALSANPGLVDAVTHAWTIYEKQGRECLSGLGDRVIVAPELGNGFGIADLVIGRTLVDIKVTKDPAAHVDQWLRQLLGYVLLDRHNILQVDTIAIYNGTQGQLLTYPIADLFRAASTGATPDLSTLRAEFHTIIGKELDEFVPWKQRKQYPLY